MSFLLHAPAAWNRDGGHLEPRAQSSASRIAEQQARSLGSWHDGVPVTAPKRFMGDEWVSGLI